MFIDFKITIWERAEIPQECESEVLEAVKNGLISSIDDIYPFIEDLGCNEDVDWEYIDDTSEYMNISENDNQTTLQVIDNGREENVLFDNAN